MGKRGLRRSIGKKSALLQIVLASILACAVPSNAQAGISSGEFTADTEMSEAQDNTDGILTPQEEGASENDSGSKWREKNNGFYYYENKQNLIILLHSYHIAVLLNLILQKQVLPVF